jgi:coenzyme F420-0:L-glutamate ligase/coenzyme F420-1:gamma-L-glutamate ligase
MTAQLVLTSLPGIPSVQEGDDLAALILEALDRARLRLESGDVLIVAQKIVSKAEGRAVPLSEISSSPQAQELARQTDKDPRVVELILQESNEILRTRPGLIVVEHRCGFVCANAGIDRSNLGGDEDRVLLLPENPQASAEALRGSLQEKTGAEIGVLIIDSHGRAWRLGTVGVAIGVAGVPALLDLRGKPDLYGRKLEITEVGLADELSAAGSILMGQADEARPVVHARGLPYPLREGSLQELLRPVEEDLFR